MREPAKTPAAARKRYVRFIQLPLTCLTKAIWVVGPSPEGGDDLSLLLSADPILLRRKDGPRLLFSASQRFELIENPRYEGEWKASTLAYIYEVKLHPEDIESDDDVELIGWHWHPRTTPDRPEPHMHVRTEYAPLDGQLAKVHLPTGRVAFEEVIRFLFCELDVVPERDDWEKVIGETEQRFKEFRTWP